jgi:hypothetical protein
MSFSSCRRLGRTALLLVLCLAVPACANKKINKTNYEKIGEGMTLQEVRDLFGEAGKKEEGDAAAGVAAQYMVDIPGAGAKKQPGAVYVWERGEITITVYFDQNGKFAAKTAKGL